MQFFLLKNWKQTVRFAHLLFFNYLIHKVFSGKHNNSTNL